MAVPAHRDPPRPTWPTPAEISEALTALAGLHARFASAPLAAPLMACERALRACRAEQLPEGLRARLIGALDLTREVSDDAIVEAVLALRPRPELPAGGQPIVVPGEVVRERPARSPHAVDDVERALVTARRLGPELQSASRGALLSEEVVAGALAVTEIDGSDVVSGSFPPRGTTVLENDWGAWMVYLPTGVGVAHACHRNLLRNRVACLAELRRLLNLPPIPASYRAEAR